MMKAQHIETLIIGAGQAGLSTGYQLQRRGRPFLIVDGNQRIGDNWRQQWDTLRLYTPAKYDGLPGLPFPAARWHCPGKDKVGDYLERYALHFDLPVRTNTRVEQLQARPDGGYVASVAGEAISCDNVVVATGSFGRTPNVPEFAGELDPAIRQLHSMEYRNPEQLADGTVLVVGAANSGTDIALEAVKTHRTLLAGRHPGQVPVDIDSATGRLFTPLVMFLFKYVFTRARSVGRKAIANAEQNGLPLTRNKLAHLDAAGITRLGRIAGVRDGLPVTADGDVLEDVTTVVWCTGSVPDHSWIDLPVCSDDGRPRHVRGVSPDEPGLLFLGLDFQYAIASSTIQGVDRDARYLVRRIRDLARRSADRPVAVDRR
jgi:putative flavoprotein involved in K+ transport